MENLSKVGTSLQYKMSNRKVMQKIERMHISIMSTNKKIHGG